MIFKAWNTFSWKWDTFIIFISSLSSEKFSINRYIFSTEGHLLPATPQISLVHEHCSYIGAFCKIADYKQESHTSDIATGLQEANGSRLHEGQVHSRLPSFTSGLIKVSGFF